jgi:hypothetical protein
VKVLHPTHQLRSQRQYGTEVELLRRADLVDAFPALFRFGLSRAWLADLFGRIRAAAFTAPSCRE